MVKINIIQKMKSDKEHLDKVLNDKDRNVCFAAEKRLKELSENASESKKSYKSFKNELNIYHYE